MDKLHSIKQLLEQGRIEEALQELHIFFETTSAPTLQNNFTVLSSRYHYLKQDEIKGIIDDPTRRQERAQIINSFSELLSNLEKTVPPPTPTTVTAMPKNGRLLHNIPPDMVRGEKCHCLVRIAENDTLLLEGLDPNRAVSISTIRLKRIIGVQILKEDNDAFDISTNNSERQSFEEGWATEWHFDIKPLKEGCHKLLLKVSGYEQIDNERVAREAIIEKEIHVVILEKATIMPHSVIWEDTGLSFDATKETKNNLFTAWFPKKALSFLATIALAAIVMIMTFNSSLFKTVTDPSKSSESIAINIHTNQPLINPLISIATSKGLFAFTLTNKGDNMNWGSFLPKSYFKGTVRIQMKDAKTNFTCTKFIRVSDFNKPINFNCDSKNPNANDAYTVILQTQNAFVNKPDNVKIDELALMPSDYTVLSSNTLKINNVNRGIYKFSVTISELTVDRRININICNSYQNSIQKDTTIVLGCVPANQAVIISPRLTILTLHLIDNQKDGIKKISSVAVNGNKLPSKEYTYEGKDTIVVTTLLRKGEKYRFDVVYKANKVKCKGINDSIVIGRYSEIKPINCQCEVVPMKRTIITPPPEPQQLPKIYWVRFIINEKWKALAKKGNYELVVNRNNLIFTIPWKDLQNEQHWQLEYGQPTLSIKAFNNEYKQDILVYLRYKNGLKFKDIRHYEGKKGDELKGEIIIDCPFPD